LQFPLLASLTAKTHFNATQKPHQSTESANFRGEEEMRWSGGRSVLTSFFRLGFWVLMAAARRPEAVWQGGLDVRRSRLRSLVAEEHVALVELHRPDQLLPSRAPAAGIRTPRLDPASRRRRPRPAHRPPERAPRGGRRRPWGRSGRGRP
jgi:hypothetical protein